MVKNQTAVPACLKLLTPEELAQVQPLTPEQILSALDKGHQEYLICLTNQPAHGPTSDIYYR